MYERMVILKGSSTVTPKERSESSPCGKSVRNAGLGRLSASRRNPATTRFGGF